MTRLTFFLSLLRRNGVALEHDHVGVQVETNDIFSLGTSTRHYLLEVRDGTRCQKLTRHA